MELNFAASIPWITMLKTDSSASISSPLAESWAFKLMAVSTFRSSLIDPMCSFRGAQSLRLACFPSLRIFSHACQSAWFALENVDKLLAGVGAKAKRLSYVGFFQERVHSSCEMAEKSCWERLLRRAAGKDCRERLLRKAAAKSCWKRLLLLRRVGPAGRGGKQPSRHLVVIGRPKRWWNANTSSPSNIFITWQFWQRPVVVGVTRVWVVNYIQINVNNWSWSPQALIRQFHCKLCDSRWCHYAIRT